MSRGHRSPEGCSIGARRRVVLAAVLALVAVVIVAGPARSALPGTDGLIAFTSDRGGGAAELWTIDPSTNATTQLTSFGAGANPVESPAWSPGGEEIAFAQGGYVFAYDVGRQMVRSITDINAGRFHGEPAWSPDGTMLALTSTDGIWRINSDGGGLVQLTDRQGDRDPAWSPDGATIAFTREVGRAVGQDLSFPGEEIYLMNGDGTGEARLTVERAATDPTWSPDGSKLAYVTRVDEQTDIVVRVPDDPDAGVLAVTTGPQFESRPAWSPTGTRIVYEKRQPGEQGRALFIASANGSGGERRLTGDPADWPDWGRVPAPATDPTCSIGSTRVDEGDGAQTRTSFEVECDNPTSATHSVGYATADGTAHAAGDYASTTGSFEAPPGKSHRQLHVNVTGDSAPEPHETFTLAFASTSVVIARPTATATILDDDSFGVAVERRSVPEGDSGSTEVELDVSLSDVADQPVSVVLAGVGTTIGFDDLEFPLSTTVTFDPGERHKAVALRVHGDLEFEGDEDFWLLANTRLIRDANVVDGRLTILDDDAARLSIDDVTVTEGDPGAATASFTVTRSHVGGAVAFDFATEDASATAGDDYAARSDRVSFDDGAQTATVSVPISDDAADEPDETFQVRLSSPANATLVDGTGVGTIADDDPEPSLTIEDASAPEGDAGAGAAHFTVSLSAPSEKLVTVDYATADGTASAPGDYSAETAQLAVARGSRTATIAIPIAGDLVDEPDETFRVRLTNPSNATVADGVAVGTITDDDPAPSVSITDAYVTEGNAGTTIAPFTVRLSRPSSRTVSIDYSTDDRTADAPDDYTSAAGTVTIAPGLLTEVLEVTVNGDGLPEADETFAITLSNAQGATLSDGEGIGTILDDEAPANDDFANAAPLAPGTTPIDTSFATVETDEPGLATPTPEWYPSVWHRLSPGRGGLALRLDRQTFFTAHQISVYRGTSLSALTLVARADNSNGNFPQSGMSMFRDVRLEIPVAAGQTYYVQILGPSPFRQGVLEPVLGRSTLVTEFQAAPANDDFADAAPLGAGATPFDASLATVEADEPGLASTSPWAHPSVWYRLSPGRGGATLQLQSTTFAAKRVSVYTGTSLGGLALVTRANTDNFPSPGSADVDVEFQTAAGDTYYVQVLAQSEFALAEPPLGSGIGGGTLRIEFQPTPANDDFADAAPLPAGEMAFDTSLATVETDEPGLALNSPWAHPSVWYRLSPGRGGVALQLRSPTLASKRVSVYTGTRLGALALVGRADSGSSFPNTPGTRDIDLGFQTGATRSYYVQVLAQSEFAVSEPPLGSGIGSGTLRMEFHPAPANDDFADAAPLGAGATAYNTSFAAVETGEPGLVSPAGETFPSIWYRLSPGLGTVSLRAESDKPRQVSVYTGTSLGTLAQVARASRPNPFPGGSAALVEPAVDLDFRTGCGTAYHVQVLGPWAFPQLGEPGFDPSAGQGTVTRGFQPTPPPANDAFADASTLAEGRTTLPPLWWTCVTAEQGEPAHAGAPAAHSIWYRATVPSGRVTIDSPGNRVAIYEGTSVPALARVADGDSGKASLVTPGGTYLIAVDGVSGTTVDVSVTPGEVATTTLGTLTTDAEPPPDHSATPTDPIETTINGPAGTRKTIFETQGATAPTAWTFFGWKVEIAAPPTPAGNPYQITFLLDATLLNGLSQAQRQQVDVFRNGLKVEDCLQPLPPGREQRDPCVLQRLDALGGDLSIRLRTTKASEWTLGLPRTTRGTVAGLLKPSSGGDAEFLVSSNGRTVAGAFSFATGGERYIAAKVGALAIAGTKAWLSGVDRNGRGFLAYVEDDGAGDRFRLWIGGVEKTDPAGRLHSGNVLIRP